MCGVVLIMFVNMINACLEDSRGVSSLCSVHCCGFDWIESSKQSSLVGNVAFKDCQWIEVHATQACL